MKQAVVSFSKLVICTSPINNTLFAAQHFAKLFFFFFFYPGYFRRKKKKNKMFMKFFGRKTRSIMGDVQTANDVFFR